MYFLFVVGTAGSGKSTLTSSLIDWLRSKNIYTVSVNLDPGVKRIPYYPEVDVREYIDIDKVMEEYGLGPNGGLIATMDLLALKLKKIVNEILSLDAEYVIIDTPGQLELFVFRDVGPYLVDELSRYEKTKTALLYLVDSNLARTPSNIISALLLGASIQYRFNRPQLNLLTKVDSLNRDEYDKLLFWTENLDNLINVANTETKGILRELTIKLGEVLKDFGTISRIIPISSITYLNFDILYAEFQRIFAGGEDYLVD
ncbi:MAG: ATP/GTP-binding protein [Candidatus Asgardarchaeia archaeon]